MIPITFLAALVAVVALTDLQVDQIIRIVEMAFKAIGSGLNTVWIALSPILVGYLVYRQAANRKALDENTKVSKEAFVEANGLKKEIAASTKLVETAVSAMAKAEPVPGDSPQNPLHVETHKAP